MKNGHTEKTLKHTDIAALNSKQAIITCTILYREKNNFSDIKMLIKLISELKTNVPGVFFTLHFICLNVSA